MTYPKLINQITTELQPVTSQKSFYRKALVTTYNLYINEFTLITVEVLTSYSTPILSKITTYKDNKPHILIYKHWNGWTATTGKHIAAFTGLNKAGYNDLHFIDWEKFSKPITRAIVNQFTEATASV